MPWLDALGDEIEMADILTSLVMEANPELTYEQTRHLVLKYEDVVWARAEEVFRGPK